MAKSKFNRNVNSDAAQEGKTERKRRRANQAS